MFVSKTVIILALSQQCLPSTKTIIGANALLLKSSSNLQDGLDLSGMSLETRDSIEFAKNIQTLVAQTPRTRKRALDTLTPKTRGKVRGKVTKGLMRATKARAAAEEKKAKEDAAQTKADREVLQALTNGVSSKSTAKTLSLENLQALLRTKLRAGKWDRTGSAGLIAHLDHASWGAPIVVKFQKNHNQGLNEISVFNHISENAASDEPSEELHVMHAPTFPICEGVRNTAGYIDIYGYKTILMEKATGGDLFDKMDRIVYDKTEEWFSPHEFTDMTSQLLRGLSNLHRMEVIHRDIKPENVLLFKDENTGKTIYRHTDYGLSYMYGPEDRTENPVVTAGVSGTLLYLAPEQARENIRCNEMTTKSDIFSLAIMLLDIMMRVLDDGLRMRSKFALLKEGLSDNDPNYRTLNTRVLNKQALNQEYLKYFWECEKYVASKGLGGDYTATQVAVCNYERLMSGQHEKLLEYVPKVIDAVGAKHGRGWKDDAFAGKLKHLFTKMLDFNPANRPTADEALVLTVNALEGYTKGTSAKQAEADADSESGGFDAVVTEGEAITSSVALKVASNPQTAKDFEPSLC